MRVELHDNLKGTTSIPASRVVVYDHFDNPLAVVVNVEGGHFIAMTVTHPDFPRLLKSLGINKTVVVNKLDTSKLKPLI
jgi:hypothetical protein